METPLDIRLGLTKASDAAHPLRWGILGGSNISADWCMCLKETPGATLAAIAARDPAKAAAFAERHGVTKVHATYEELVKDPGVDIVYVGTITPLHKQHSMLAITAGKHVLCEKPLAETAEDAREMYAAAEAKGVMLQEGMWTRYFPAVEHARLVMESGEIGNVNLVQADFTDMCYAVQFAPFAFGAGPPTAVVATGDLSGDGAGAAIVNYGVRGCAVLTFPPWKSEFPEVCEIVGTKGRITLSPWAHSPTQISVRISPDVCYQEPQGHTSTSQNGIPPLSTQAEYPVPEPAGYPDPNWHYVNQHGFVYQAAAVHRCLAAGLKECPQFPKADSLRIMELLDTMQQRSKRLEVVQIGCGAPNFSMGWTHLEQVRREPLKSVADVVGVVEPFFLSEAGKQAKGADIFRAYMAEQPEIKFVASCDGLPEVAAGKVRVAIIAVRTADSRAAFEDAVLKLGCRAVYLEKPGASSIEEFDKMIELAEQKGVTVMMGYSRNMGTYITRGRACAAELEASTGTKSPVTLLHSNPWKDEDMAECFVRCQPGMFYDMACHDIAIAVAYYGLTADSYTDLTVNTDASLQTTHGGIEDFVRVSFSLRPTAGAEPISFVIDRQTGAFNGMEVGGQRFLSGEPPLLFENPLKELSPHLAVQYDYYVEAKRVLFAAVATAPLPSSRDTAALPLGVPTMRVAREVMRLAEQLTRELKELVPRS
eukprot:TRINITY_DN20075_c0_g1_i1.p1 TRINITY_DN20075_c0_g1~~TRINITY_DN20075_c0_g1_i1.p1  ORF type:complete len:749 (-),score=131.77 TRINITY_DN20075_c0_g1_i1:139-2259(-)